MSLTADERETVILFSDESDVATIYTCARPIMTKLDKLCKSNPDTYKMIKEDSTSKTYTTKKNLISFRTPKILSEEQKLKLLKNIGKQTQP
jgi:hypothetical protein